MSISMFNFRISILTLAIIGYFVARVIMSNASTPKDMNVISVDEQHVQFNTFQK